MAKKDVKNIKMCLSSESLNHNTYRIAFILTVPLSPFSAPSPSAPPLLICLLPSQTTRNFIFKYLFKLNPPWNREKSLQLMLSPVFCLCWKLWSKSFQSLWRNLTQWRQIYKGFRIVYEYVIQDSLSYPNWFISRNLLCQNEGLPRPEWEELSVA